MNSLRVRGAIRLQGVSRLWGSRLRNSCWCLRVEWSSKRIRLRLRWKCAKMPRPPTAATMVIDPSGGAALAQSAYESCKALEKQQAQAWPPVVASSGIGTGSPVVLGPNARSSEGHGRATSACSAACRGPHLAGPRNEQRVDVLNLST